MRNVAVGSGCAEMRRRCDKDSTTNALVEIGKPGKQPRFLYHHARLTGAASRQPVALTAPATRWTGTEITQSAGIAA
jgi:hypothetical protein